MIKWKKSEIICIICILSLTTIVPIIIYFLFKSDFKISFLYSTWSSGDILQYCGAILASLVAISGVYYSLKENRKENLKKLNVENKPYLVSNTIQLTNINAKETFSNNNNSIQIIKNHVYFFYDLRSDCDKIKFQDHYDKMKTDDYMLLMYEVENVGLGTAINFQINYAVKDTKIYPYKTKYLKKEEKLIIYIYIEKKLMIDEEFKLHITITYDDITNINTYEQKEIIITYYIQKQNSYNYDRFKCEPLSEPKLIHQQDF